MSTITIKARSGKGKEVTPKKLSQKGDKKGGKENEPAKKTSNIT